MSIEVIDGEENKIGAICLSCWHRWQTKQFGRVICPYCHNNGYRSDDPAVKRAVLVRCGNKRHNCGHIWWYRGFKTNPREKISCPNCQTSFRLSKGKLGISNRLQSREWGVKDMTIAWIIAAFPKAKEEEVKALLTEIYKI